MPDKPTITDQHLQKYEEIMKTGTLDSGAPAPLPTSSKNPADESLQKSRISQLLSNLPKPKGVGEKMFIFNGKKKIIMEGGEKEVEKAKTIDAKEIKKQQKEEEKKEEITPEPVKPIKAEEDTEAEKKLEKKLEGKKETTKEEKKKTAYSPKKLILGGGILVVIWTLVWAYFLGFFSLIGL